MSTTLYNNHLGLNDWEDKKLGWIPLLALCLVSALWGSHAVVGKAVESQLDPLTLALLRFTLCALCYVPIFGRFRRILTLPKKQFWQLAFTGLCWAVLYPLLWYQSLRYLPPVVSLLLVNTSPFFAALFGWLFLRERLALREWLGILVSFVGVLILVGGDWGGSIWGMVLALVAAIAFASYTVSSKSLFQSLPLFDVLLATSVWGAVFLWIIVLVTGQVGKVFHATMTLSGQGWSEALYIVIVVGTIAYILYGYGLKRLPAAISSAVTFYPQVLFAALIQWVWLGMVPSIFTWLSALLILGGTAMMGRKNQKWT